MQLQKTWSPRGILFLSAKYKNPLSISEKIVCIGQRLISRFLPPILEISTLTDQLYERFLKMVKTMEQSNNMRVQNITKFSKISAKSIIGSNMRIICRRLKLDNISQLMNMVTVYAEKDLLTGMHC